MKLFLFFISICSVAYGSFVSESEVNLCSRTVYTSMTTCQKQKSETCYATPEDDVGQCGVYKLKDLYGSVKFDQESCEGQQACEALLLEKVCGVGRHALIDAEYTEVYCVEVIGKELVVDQSLKAQADAQKAMLAQVEATINAGKKAREDCLRVLDLIGGFNLGRSGSETDQMVEAFAVVKQHLQDGLPGKAKYAIQQIPVDGVLVTQTMKDLALYQLSEYEARP